MKNKFKSIFAALFLFSAGCLHAEGFWQKIKNTAIGMYETHFEEKDLGAYTKGLTASNSCDLYIPIGATISIFDGRKVSWSGGIASQGKIRIPSGKHSFYFYGKTKIPAADPVTLNPVQQEVSFEDSIDVNLLPGRLYTLLYCIVNIDGFMNKDASLTSGIYVVSENDQNINGLIDNGTKLYMRAYPRSASVSSVTSIDKMACRIYTKDGARVNVRSNPGAKNTTVVGQVYNGTKVTVSKIADLTETYEGITDKWVFISDGKTSGWVFGGYVVEDKVKTVSSNSGSKTKRLSASEYKQMLSKVSPGEFPAKIDGDVKSFDVSILGEVSASYGNVVVVRADVVWGYSGRMTSRIAFFVNNKPYGSFYEYQPHETFELNGSILTAWRNRFDLRNGIPSSYTVGDTNYKLEKF